jgi:uncharacterized membrane protein YozB (DUF420 family)
MKIMAQGSDGGPANSVSTAVKARRWWQRPWIAPLVMVAIAFIAFSLPPYLTFDSSKSRIRPPEGFALYYPLLVAHVLFASIAMLMCCIQVWPWFRERYPAAHRRIGYIYVFGGVIPAGVIGLTIGAVSPYGPTLRVSNVLLAMLWLAFTITGFRMVRQHRLVEHRRWMLRSFALTMSVITNRVWTVIALIVLMPQLPTTFEGNETMMIQAVAGLSGWLGWVIPLLFAEWWLERSDTARARANAGLTAQ